MLAGAGFLTFTAVDGIVAGAIEEHSDSQCYLSLLFLRRLRVLFRLVGLLRFFLRGTGAFRCPPSVAVSFIGVRVNGRDEPRTARTGAVTV
ncbi:hypothetical protein D3C81_1741570 [compost metagenome]